MIIMINLAKLKNQLCQTSWASMLSVNVMIMKIIILTKTSHLKRPLSDLQPTRTLRARFWRLTLSSTRRRVAEKVRREQLSEKMEWEEKLWLKRKNKKKGFILRECKQVWGNLVTVALCQESRATLEMLLKKGKFVKIAESIIAQRSQDDQPNSSRARAEVKSELEMAVPQDQS